MKYNKYTIKTTTEAEDIISAVLSDIGINGIEIEDAIPWTDEDRQNMFVDELVLPDIPEGEAHISFYLESDSDTRAMLKKVIEALTELKKTVNIGEATIDTSVTEDRDWINNWKTFFHQFEICFEDGRKVVLVPSWEQPQNVSDGETLIHIDPGTAFGTGAHETTQLCIREIEKAVRPGMKLIDVGTGSGILALMALKFGASSVTGTDLDPNAVPAVKDNFEKNGLTDSKFRLLIGDVITDEDIRKQAGNGYDIFVANILPVVLIPLIPVIRDFIRPGGKVILSGILEEKADPIAAALRDNGYTVISVNRQGEWVSVTAEDQLK